MGEYRTTVALISVTDVETQAVMRLYKWKKKIFASDSQVYYEAAFTRITVNPISTGNSPPSRAVSSHSFFMKNTCP